MTDGRLPAVRAVRSLALASTAVGAGLVAHWSAGGGTPHPVALLVVLALLTLPVARLSVREVSPAAAVAVLGSGQLAVHLTGMAHHAATTGGGHHPTVALSAPGGHAPGVGMVTGHLVVTLVLAVAWSRGERILFAVAARLHPPTMPRWGVPSPATLRPCTLAPAGASHTRRPLGRGPPRPAR